MLADLGRGVGRLKTQSVMINEETSLHVRLLGDMEGDAERASSGLRNEALHAEKVRSVLKTLFTKRKYSARFPSCFARQYVVQCLKLRNETQQAGKKMFVLRPFWNCQLCHTILELFVPQNMGALRTAVK